MNWRRDSLEAYHNLCAAKLRSFLAILGVLVGTAAVVALVSVGELATREALQQFRLLGTELMSVSINAYTDESRESLKQFSVKDVMAIKKSIPEIQKAAPYAMTFSQVSYEGMQLSSPVIGLTSTLQDVIKIKIARGRAVSALDGFGLFCVIGAELDQRFRSKFGRDPLGQQVQVGNQFLTIVGIAKPWQENAFFFQNINHSLMIPLQAMALLSQSSSINNIVFKLNPQAKINSVTDKLHQAFQKNLPKVRVFFRSAKQLIESMKKQNRIFTLFLGVIGGISLLVGGIGVMNIMLVSVVERKREIGIRKALGAKQKDIRALFLIESIMLSLLGGVLGVVFGLLVTVIIAHFAHWHWHFFLLPTVLGFCVSLLVGVFFGFYPAVQAARLDPIACLRSD